MIPRSPARLLGLCAAAPLLLLGGCAGPGLESQLLSSFEKGCEAQASGDQQRAVREAETLLVLLPEEDPAAPLWRFHAESLLAHAHLAAAVGTSFRMEESGRDGTPRPSWASHLVATIHHALQARVHYPRAVEIAGAPRSANLPIPLTLEDLQITGERLRILTAVAYSRLGLRGEVDAILIQYPDLVRRWTFFPALERLRIPSAVHPWICDMVHHHLRSRNEVEAYRFGIMAVEGEHRFGHALTPEAVASIDRWILHGATMLFVCPESQTAYTPGTRHSPISGVPHIDYIPVKRPPAER